MGFCSLPRLILPLHPFRIFPDRIVPTIITRTIHLTAGITLVLGGCTRGPIAMGTVPATKKSRRICICLLHLRLMGQCNGTIVNTWDMYGHRHLTWTTLYT